jgi:hypothetical protein
MIYLNLITHQRHHETFGTAHIDLFLIKLIYEISTRIRDDGIRGDRRLAHNEIEVGKAEIGFIHRIAA